MSAERILNRLEVYQRQLSARIEVVARIVELGGRPAWEYFAHDLDAAINDIRGMLAEPVTVEDANKRIVKEILSFDVECD